MKVSIIGGTGFVGSYIVDRLVEAGHTPRLLVRPDNEGQVEPAEVCERILGDVGDRAAVSECLSGAEAVIYLIGILREYPERGITFEELQYRAVERVIKSAAETQTQRFLLMSANGVKADGTPYQRTKHQAEESLKKSDLAWTIFQPSVIYGDPRGRREFCTQLRRDIIDSPLPAPLFFGGLLPTGAGAFELAPVRVEDVAEAFVRALEMPETIRQTFPLCGPEPISWKQILTTIATTVGKRKFMVPASAIAIKAAASVLDSQPWFPITKDQITMLLEGNVCDDPSAFPRLGIEPSCFDEKSLAYLNAQVG